MELDLATADAGAQLRPQCCSAQVEVTKGAHCVAAADPAEHEEGGGDLNDLKNAVVDPVGQIQTS